ncbi:hypothetical protein LSUE1_G008391, partial [Lachnellula suecica]
PPRSLNSSPGAEPFSSSSPPPRITTDASFTVEEFDSSDYEEFDSDDGSVIRPHQYEDAESEPARSVKGSASQSQHDLPTNIYNGLRDLHCEPTDSAEAQQEMWQQKMRAEKRRKRRSSGSIQKRTFSQSIGSDTDDEDLHPVFEGANEAGSSARRLRRKGENERASLIFDDPPPRIDELEEPESCEEVVEDEDEDGEGQGVDRNLPYYVQDMDVDSDEED